MRVTATYSHKGALALFSGSYADLIEEIHQAIRQTNAAEALTKESEEVTMTGRMLYSPVKLNQLIKANLYPLGWATPTSRQGKYSEPRVRLTTTVEGSRTPHTGFRAMDGLKGRVGLEIQFGKYAFMGYDILAKMVIFNRLGLIDAGVEVVPMKSLSTGGGRGRRKLAFGEDSDARSEGDPADASSLAEASRMSTGVSYFEQIKADLEARGVADLDIPVLIVGIDA